MSSSIAKRLFSGRVGVRWMGERERGRRRRPEQRTVQIPSDVGSSDARVVPVKQEWPMDPARLAREDGGAAPGTGRGAWGVEQRWKILSRCCLATEPAIVVALGGGMEDTESVVAAFTRPVRTETMDSVDFRGEPFHDTVLEGSEEVESEPPR